MLIPSIGALSCGAGAVGLTFLSAVGAGSPEAPFLQYGALGLAGMMVWFNNRNNAEVRKENLAREQKMGEIVEKHEAAVEKLHEQVTTTLVDTVNRNSKAIEGCLGRQREVKKP
jgi:hypothetical protein